MVISRRLFTNGLSLYNNDEAHFYLGETGEAGDPRCGWKSLIPLHLILGCVQSVCFSNSPTENLAHWRSAKTRDLSLKIRKHILGG